MVLVVGIAIIAVGNLLGIGAWWLAGLVSLAMGGFAYVVRDIDIAGDAKGDSIYYLGLLFTFAALVAALIAFDWGTSGADGNATSGAIRNFGIALLTTIVGLVGRVWFAMLQESPGDIADTAKSALDEAVSEMSASLARAREDLDTMANKFRESARDLGETGDTIAATARRAADTSGSLEEYAAQVAGAARSFTDGMGDFHDAVGAGTAAAANFTRSLGAIGDQTRVFEGHMGALREQLKDVHSTFVGISTVAAPTARAIEKTSHGVAAAAAEAASLGRALSRLRHSASEAERAFAGVAGSVGATQVIPVMKEAVARVEDGSQRIRSVGQRAATVDGELAGLGESAMVARHSITSVSGAAQSIGRQVAEAGNDLSESVGAVRKRAQSLNADLGAMGDQSAKVSNTLVGVARQAQGLSDDIRRARETGVHGRRSGGRTAWIARTLRRIGGGLTRIGRAVRRRR